MKKKYLSVGVACILAGSLMFSSCVGSFSLTSKLLKWNRNISNKFVNELVFFAFWILPVYQISGLADVLVLNSIEFWSGNNPVAKGKKIIEGNDGKYLVECDGKGYTITSQNDGSEVRLDFASETKSWYITTETESRLLFTYVDDNHILLPATDGTYRQFELSAEGLYAYQSEITGMMFAQR